MEFHPIVFFVGERPRSALERVWATVLAGQTQSMDPVSEKDHGDVMVFYWFSMGLYHGIFYGVFLILW